MAVPKGSKKTIYKNRDKIVKSVNKREIEHLMNCKTYQPPTEKGSNTEYINVIMQFAALPDIDLKDDKQVRNRLIEFYQICANNDFKPTVSSLACCFGWTRRELHGVVSEDPSYYHIWQNLSIFALSQIKKGYETMSQLWESYMQNGKINPVSGIFLGKNNFGYVDKVEHTLIAKREMNEDELQQRYLDIKDEESD